MNVRRALIAVAAVIVVVGGIGAVLLARLDPNAYKPDIVQAVKHATGRDLTLNGQITLKPSLWPTIQVNDVAFSNPPGFSRPQMATLQGMELQLALLPLLSRRIEIDRLVLIHPDILLETDAAGHANWRLAPEVSPPAPAGPQQPVKSSSTATAVSIDTIRIQDGTLAYRDGATAKTTTLGLPSLAATATSSNSPLHVDADASYNGTAFKLIADTGSLSRLQDPAATSAWPVKLALTVAGAKLAADGSVTQPLRGRGFDVAVNGTIPDVAALAPLLQGFVPPPLHDVQFAAKIFDKGGNTPEFSTLTLHAGKSDLGGQMPGLQLDALNIDAPNPTQPVKVNLAARLANAPLTVVGTLGPLAMLMPDAKPAAFPVDLTMQAGIAIATAKGAIEDARAMTGANIAVTAQIPDLSALSPLARRPLPALKAIAFHATLTDANGGFTHGAALHGMALTSADGDLSGDATIGLGARHSLTAALKSNRFDLDAVQAAIDQMPGASPPASAQPTPAPAKPRGDRLFSDQPIPFDLLRSADADLKLDVADLRTGGADYKAINAHAVLKAGKLSVDPFAADLPGGHLSSTLSVDATQPAPPAHLVLHAPGLALKSLLTLAHQPSYANGNLEVYANLSGSGASPHAIAASLDGTLGLAIAGGAIDNRLVGSLLGKVMDSLNALNLVGKGGASDLRCFALRMDAQHGTAAVKPLALSSSLLTMTGAGTINLGAETLALTLRPEARVGGTPVLIPIAVSGPIREPSVKVNDLGAAEANAGTVAHVVIGNATPLGIVGGLLGGNKLPGGAPADICAPALALARGQAVPEAAATAPTSKPAANDPAAALRNLFR